MVVWNMAVCDVCRLLDGDMTEKLCYYCPKCNAQICVRDSHSDAWLRRMHAAAWRQWEKLNGVFA